MIDTSDKVFMISSRNSNLVYIGSTTQSLNKYLSTVKCRYKRGYTINKGLKLILALEDIRIMLLDKFQVISYEELEAVKRQYITFNGLDCTNL